VLRLHAQETPQITRQQALVKEGLALLEAGKSDAARAPLEEARTLAHDAGDVASEASATRGLGQALLAAKDTVGARARFDEALRLYGSIHNLRGMGGVHSSLGFLAWTEANWPEVRRFYREAADEFGEAGDPAGRANNLRNMTFDRTMTDADIIDVLREAWEVVKPLGDANGEGLILHQWGDVLVAQGDYGAAFEKLEAAAALLQRAGSPLDVSYVSTSLGRAYRLNGLPEKAKQYFEAALAIQQRAGNQRAIAQSLEALSLVATTMGRYADALDLARRALGAARASGNRASVVSAILQLSEKQLDLERYADALALVTSSLTDLHEPAMKREEVFFRVSLARAYAGGGRFDDAAREADQSVALADTDDRPDTLIWTLEQRARIRLRFDDDAGALADTQRALAVVERLRATLPRRDFLKRGFSDANQRVFALAIDVDVHMKDAAGALVVAEQARARAFQDLLATRAQSSNASHAASEPGVLASGASVEAPTLDEIKAVVARLHSPLLAYWVAPHEAFVWAVTTAGHVEVRRIPVDATRLEALARTASAGPAGAQGGHQLRELYDLLIKPVRSVLQSEPAIRLTVIPHGPLFRVSFAALVDEHGRYLVEHYEMHYAPAVGVLRFTANNVRGSGIRSALLVADPDLPRETFGDGLPPLSGARLEVADAARQLGARSETLVGKQATEARVRQLVAGRDLLHLATHGIVSDRDPLGSYLAFSASGTDTTSDGRLTSAEIYGLDISADLVVLSACRSGAGKITGDGIIGLTRGFFYAGAPSVLATLWDVADEPARFLMRRFYAHWLAGGSKATALRAAQLDLIRALRAGAITVKTPFGPTTLTERAALWASFVLLGEP
jgi:CHAT domain-containing protein